MSTARTVVMGPRWRKSKEKCAVVIRPRLELGTFCVLDRCDNQLRHRTAPINPHLVFIPIGVKHHLPETKTTTATTTTTTTTTMSAISRWTLWSLSGCTLLVLALVQCTEQAASLGERQLRPLSLSALAALVGSPDPVKNIDPSNRRSHLSHILIPRPRTLLASLRSLSSPH